MAVDTVDVRLSTETELSITLASITRKRTDCFRITLTVSVIYTEHWQTHADIVPIPLESIVNWDTDPETLYTKSWVVEHIWGESITDTIYTNLVADIQTDLNGYMKERHLTSAAKAPINLLSANLAFDPDWTP